MPTHPRPAATIVLMRDGDAGLEVLLMKRSRTAGFVPGAYVFPGGRVDDADGDGSLAERLHGLTPVAAAARLGLEDTVTAVGYYVAALREAFEETGILVATQPDGSDVPTAAASADVDTIRDDLLEDRISFTAALDALGCTLDGGDVAYLAHWITPVVEPRRYDTRFFAARVAAGSESVVDPREMTDAVWLTPERALHRHRDGNLPMVFPTIKTLQHLAPFTDVDQALAELNESDVPAILPRLVMTDTGVAINIPEVAEP